MSRVHLELCELLLREYYGETVAKVGAFLLKNTASNLANIAKHTCIDIKQIKSVLSALIQQNIVSFEQVKPGLTTYSADRHAVLWRLRFPRYINCAKTLYGDAAELLVEELLLQGQSHLDSAVMKTTKKLNDSIINNQAAIPEIQPSVIKDKVTTLVKAYLIRRCEDLKLDEVTKLKSSVIPVAPRHIRGNLYDETLFVIPTADDFKAVTGSKRPAEGGAGPVSKKIKLEIGSAEGTATPPNEPGVSYWCVNFHQFHHHFKHQAILAAIARNIDQRASEVMRAMLRLSESISQPHWDRSGELSFNEIFGAIPKDKGLNQQKVDQYLKILTENCHGFVTCTGDSGGGTYVINFFNAIRALCISQIETIVLERFGSKALRMFKVIIEKKEIEQKQIEDLAMLPPKEAKEILYKMFAENYVTLTELSKAPDHAPARTFYLFNVNLIQVTRMLLEKCYKAVANVMIRRDKCLTDNKRLLDKQERVEAIIASLSAEAAEEQSEEIQQLVTPSERTQLKKVADASKTLEQSELHLDHTIFIFESFLQYTLKPAEKDSNKAK